MQLEAIRTLVCNELAEVDEMIQQFLESQVPLTREISQHLISSGGKRIRPLVLLLSAKSCGEITATHIKLAAVLEFIHSATLLHDDVVDQSQKRRGRYTANLIWGNAAPILVGDFLYSRAFQMIVSIQSMKILEILALATNVIAEGEVLQLAKRHDPNITEETYLQIIYAKTAKLFEVAAQLGALKQQNNFFEVCLQQYGKHVGIAFQLIDDVLDYSASPDIMGKNVGDDLAEGKTTLPLLHALEKGSADQKVFIQKAIQQGSMHDFTIIQEAIVNTGAIDYTRLQAKKEVDHALQVLNDLPPSPYRDALGALAEFAIHRNN